MGRKVLEAVTRALKEGKRVALVTVMEKRGSVSGMPGSIMAVVGEGLLAGTVGGGQMEYDIIEKAKGAILTGNPEFFAYDPKTSGMEGYTGGISGCINVLYPDNRLVLFGAGHVCQKVALLAGELGFDIYAADDREDLLKLPAFSHVRVFYNQSYEKALEELRLNKETFVVIATKGPQWDKIVLLEALKAGCRYIGMVGNKRKVADIIAEMKNIGFQKEQLDKVYAPIGLNIANGAPEEIAFSILSEILSVKNGRQPVHLRDGMGKEESDDI